MGVVQFNRSGDPSSAFGVSGCATAPLRMSTRVTQPVPDCVITICGSRASKKQSPPSPPCTYRQSRAVMPSALRVADGPIQFPLSCVPTQTRYGRPSSTFSRYTCAVCVRPRNSQWAPPSRLRYGPPSLPSSSRRGLRGSMASACRSSCTTCVSPPLQVRPESCDTSSTKPGR